MTDLQRLTSSRMRTFNDCKRLEYWSYGEMVRSAREEESLRVGSLVHVGLEEWLREMVASPHPGHWIEASLHVVAKKAIDHYEQVRVDEMLRGYHERWKHDDLDVVAVELEFTAPLVNPDTNAKSRTFQIAGKIDAIVRVDGRLYILEHKTTSEDITDPSSGYFERLSMDAQVSMYYLGAMSLGYEVDGCIYDVIRKPGLRPSGVPLTDDDGIKIVLDDDGERVMTKTGRPRQTGDTKLGYVLQKRDETPAEYAVRILKSIQDDPERHYQRHEVHRIDSELREFLYDAWGSASQIRDLHNAARKKGTHVVPRNSSACHRYGRRCFLWPVCSTGMNPDEHPDRFKRLDTPHPELGHQNKPSEQGVPF